MTFRFLVAAGLALAPVSAALAQSASHTEAAALSGRSPVKTYRPIAQQANCTAVQPHHQTGKIPLPPVVSVDRAACAMQMVERDSGQRKD